MTVLVDHTGRADGSVGMAIVGSSLWTRGIRFTARPGRSRDRRDVAPPGPEEMLRERSSPTSRDYARGCGAPLGHQDSLIHRLEVAQHAGAVTPRAAGGDRGLLQ